MRRRAPAADLLAGLAEFDGSESAEELVGRADAALFEAKAQGRDRTVVAPGP